MIDIDPKREARLDALLDSLPRDIEPRRDLWSGIATAIVAPTGNRARPPVALAAGIATAVVGILVLIRMVPPPAMVADTAVPSAIDEGQRAEKRYNRAARFEATRADLVRRYEAQVARLDPKTRMRIAADLAVIRRAEDDIRAAYATDPGSALLARLYENVMRQEFDLYATVGLSDNPSQGNGT